MKSAPRVSVILPVFNSARYLHEAITSILNQTFKDFELIIIDDKSTDESLKIIKSFSDHRIRILRNKKNLDITASLNLGIKSARGDYLARMDADDISLPERFQIQDSF
jgi:glycosyltransferase involved in cell wall biosynthesis